MWSRQPTHEANKEGGLQLPLALYVTALAGGDHQAALQQLDKLLIEVFDAEAVMKDRLIGTAEYVFEKHVWSREVDEMITLERWLQKNERAWKG